MLVVDINLFHKGHIFQIVIKTAILYLGAVFLKHLKDKKTFFSILKPFPYIGMETYLANP